MSFVIVTGMSGAGKSKTINALEDLGYFCVDNMPPAFLLEFVAMQTREGEEPVKAAVVIDARSKATFKEFYAALGQMREAFIPFKLLFLDADPAVLLQRYKETRRMHPMYDQANASIQDAIRREQLLLAPLREQADYIIDTSHILLSQLKERIVSLLCGAESQRGLFVQCMSFGYKNGLPSEADLVFDVRCLPNPFYDPTLKALTGLTEPIQEYVLKWPQTQALLEKLMDLLAFLLPLYVAEGKSLLVLAIGCTGGKHRSIVMAEQLSAYLRSLSYNVGVCHRDIDK